MIVYNSLPEKCPAAATAVALGMFDGLHRGHMAVLNALVKEAGDASPCVFTFSTNAEKPPAKTDAHLLSSAMRDNLLAGLGVEYVFQPEFSEFRDMPPEKFADEILSGYLNAKMVFCGEDFRFGKGASSGAGDLRRMLPESVLVRVIPIVSALGAGVSTTRIRGLILAGDIPAANELLGRAFTIDFAVEYGRRLGRRLDWPTINQAFPPDFVVPRFGVYASYTTIGENCYQSVTNIGIKPTVGSDHILCETHIKGFSGDLYGRSIPVELLEFIREEKKFDSVEALKAQIEADNIRAIEICEQKKSSYFRR